ncbi:MAG: hypothetical protein GX020_06905 [Firmicutes bacterium]|nr:hypothetical protein [Bacillota bacterium]
MLRSEIDAYIQKHGRVITPPPELGLHEFYKKYYKSASGIHICSSEKVKDDTFIVVASVADVMLSKREDIRQALIEQKCRIGIMAADEITTDIPEHSRFPQLNWARGLGGYKGNAFSTCGEENIWREENDRYKREYILPHEFGHTIHLAGIQVGAPDLFEEIKDAYQEAVSKGLWQNTYAGSNEAEYFAEGVQFWFNVGNYTLDGKPNGVHNHVHNRKLLKEYDIRLYNIMADVFPETLLPKPWDIDS